MREYTKYDTEDNIDELCIEEIESIAKRCKTINEVSDITINVKLNKISISNENKKETESADNTYVQTLKILFIEDCKSKEDKRFDF